MIEHLQQLLGEGDGDDAGGAAHAADAVGHHIRPHLEAVHDAGAQARRGAVQRAVGDEDVDLRAQAGLFRGLGRAGLMSSFHRSYVRSRLECSPVII